MGEGVPGVHVRSEIGSAQRTCHKEGPQRRPGQEDRVVDLRIPGAVRQRRQQRQEEGSRGGHGIIGSRAFGWLKETLNDGSTLSGNKRSRSKCEDLGDDVPSGSVRWIRRAVWEYR